jgi:hypothetical protein
VLPSPSAASASFDVDEPVTPQQVEAALHTLHAAGEVTRDDSGRWSLVPYDRSIFRQEGNPFAELLAKQ